MAEHIAFVLIMGGIIFAVGAVMLYTVWKIITMPYCYYKLNNPNNKLQWQCREINKSREQRLNHESNVFVCSVGYRILPSELNKFVKTWGDNDWIYPFREYKTFHTEDDFKEFVKNWKTYGDWKKYKDKKEGIIWYEPPMDEN